MHPFFPSTPHDASLGNRYKARWQLRLSGLSPQGMGMPVALKAHIIPLHIDKDIDKGRYLFLIHKSIIITIFDQTNIISELIHFIQFNFKFSRSHYFIPGLIKNAIPMPLLRGTGPKPVWPAISLFRGIILYAIKNCITQ